MTEAHIAAAKFKVAVWAFIVLMALTGAALAVDHYLGKQPCAETFKQARTTGATCVATEFGTFTTVNK
jgi:hypothetical protein